MPDVRARPRLSAPVVASVRLILVLTAACAPVEEAEPSLASEQAAVVFGDDGRQEYYEVTDPGFAALLRRSTVALVDESYIDLTDPANVVPDTVTLGDHQSLCDGERFASQPAMAYCSGTLIDDDLVLTAGHCIDAHRCLRARFVFGFYMEDPAQLRPMTADDVYECDSLLVHEDAVEGNTVHDYAIVKLDRPVTGDRAPAPILMDATAVQPGDAITALGFGDGIPGKVHGDATVNAVADHLGFFMGSTDTFASNSGSGTYNSTHQLVGIYVRGRREDYQRLGVCQVVNTVPDDEALQEYSYAHRPVHELCASGYPSERLCHTPRKPAYEPPPSRGPGVVWEWPSETEVSVEPIEAGPAESDPRPAAARPAVIGSCQVSLVAQGTGAHIWIFALGLAAVAFIREHTL